MEAASIRPKNCRLSPAWLPCWLVMGLMFSSATAVAEPVMLSEADPQSRAFRTRFEMGLNGQVQIVVSKEKVVNLDSNAKANFTFQERRLESAGRDARNHRTLRIYETAGSIVEKPEYQALRLRPQVAKIVVEGNPDGVTMYSPSGPMVTSEVELLATPGDPVAVTALLPNRSIEVGDVWKPDSWSTQMLMHVEAVLKEEFQCKLESVSDGIARISFEGKMEGAILGASTEITLTGSMNFDVAEKYVRDCTLIQHEKRSVGAVSPGLDFTANVKWARSLVTIPASLSDQVLSAIPLDPPEKALLTAYDFPWRVRFHHDRNWHIFHQTSDVALFRLIEQGELVAQCTIRPLEDARPGQHSSEQEFQQDIRTTLGESLSEITGASQIKTTDGRFIYRVTAVGRTNTQDVTWLYYLCAAPSGKQIAAVFTVRTDALPQLDGRDVAMMSGITFLP